MLGGLGPKTWAPVVWSSQSVGMSRKGKHPCICSTTDRYASKTSRWGRSHAAKLCQRLSCWVVKLGPVAMGNSLAEWQRVGRNVI